MPSTDAPNWWADVQQEREDLAGPGRRPAEDWLGEDIDFVPRRRMRRGDHPTPAEPRLDAARTGDDTALHGVFIPTDATDRDNVPAERRASAAVRDDIASELRTSATPRDDVPAERRASAAVRDDITVSRRASAAVRHDIAAERRAGAVAAFDGLGVAADEAPTGRTIELTIADDVVIAETSADIAHDLAHLSAADDPFASPPPPAGVRRTVQIKGRPTSFGLPSMAQRHRGRSASERVGHRPDRIALWAVALGAVLILLAAMTSSSQAAVRHATTHTPRAAAKVHHITRTTPAPAPVRTLQP